MATTAFRGTSVQTVGELPAIGSPAPAFSLTGTDLADFAKEDLAGRRIVLNIFPSIDTGVCATSVRTFNALAADLEDTVVVCASKDLPFAHKRFCGAEGIEHVSAASAFRSDFGEVLGVTMSDGPMAGLLARSVVVIDADGTVVHTELVPEIGQEPDYDRAIAALS
jgi:thioredoxin-dependent peroxiredoxin